MAQQGSTTINFGAFPGATDVTATVTGITGSPTAGEAWIVPTATADHSADEHWVDPPRIVAATPSGGNMTIYGAARDGITRVYGLWTIGWVVN